MEDVKNLPTFYKLIAGLHTLGKFHVLRYTGEVRPFLASHLRKKMEAYVIELEMKIKDQQALGERISVLYSRSRDWSAEFRLAEIDRNRSILSQLCSPIELHRNCKIRFVPDAKYQQFLEEKTEPSVNDLVAKTGNLSARPVDTEYSKMSVYCLSAAIELLC